MRVARERSYRDLVAWQRAMDLAHDVHVAIRRWPREEQFGLTDQIRRAAASVPANVAEGQGRLGARELVQHLSIAHGSLCEVETHLQLAQRLSHIKAAECDPLLALADEGGRV